MQYGTKHEDRHTSLMEWYRENPEMSPMYKVKMICNRGTKITQQGKGKSFSTNGAEKNGYQHVKMKIKIKMTENKSKINQNSQNYTTCGEMNYTWQWLLRYDI